MRKVALFLIRAYRSVSRFFPRHCVYSPTCSEYAQEAFSKKSFFKALKLTLCRVLRCNPFTKGGFDPVSPVRDRLPKVIASLNNGNTSNGVR